MAKSIAAVRVSVGELPEIVPVVFEPEPEALTGAIKKGWPRLHPRARTSKQKQMFPN